MNLSDFLYNGFEVQKSDWIFEGQQERTNHKQFGHFLF